MAKNTNEAREQQKKERLGMEKLNNQGCLMKIVEYNKTTDMTVEFQDKRKTRVKARWQEFERGSIKNPYHPTIYGVGCIGTKYHARPNRKTIFKEYATWRNMLFRCYGEAYLKHPTHKDATVCEEWLCYENFYDWLHEQSNIENFLDGNNWILNRKIIVKDNDIYSPDTCCLVPQNVDKLFRKHNLNTDNVPDRVLKAYKEQMENIIKRVAKEEFANGNISNQCYEAMMVYEVDI